VPDHEVQEVVGDIYDVLSGNFVSKSEQTLNVDDDDGAEVAITFGNVEETIVDQERNLVFSDGVTFDLPSVVGNDRFKGELVVESRRLHVPEQKSIFVVVSFRQKETILFRKGSEFLHMLFFSFIQLLRVTKN